jgi:hypothetical protein
MANDQKERKSRLYIHPCLFIIAQISFEGANQMTSRPRCGPAPPLFIVDRQRSALGACSDGKPAAPPAMGPLPVTVLEVQPQKIPTSIEVMAQTEGARETEVRARVGGILVKRLYQEGETVKAGQALFQIDPSSLRNRPQRSPRQGRASQPRNEALERPDRIEGDQPEGIRRCAFEQRHRPSRIAPGRTESGVDHGHRASRRHHRPRREVGRQSGHGRRRQPADLDLPA